MNKCDHRKDSRGICIFDCENIPKECHLVELKDEQVPPSYCEGKGNNPEFGCCCQHCCTCGG